MPPGIGPNGGNPLVTQNNRTVVDNITSGATGAVNNLLNNATGALGTVGSIASGITDALNSSGVNSLVSGALMATKLDNLISGSSSFFGSGSPLRTTLNALGLRNQTASQWVDPDSVINAEKANSTGTVLVFPPDPAPYTMTFDFFKYQRMNPLANTELVKLSSVVLPLPSGSGLEDTTSVDWQSQSLGMYGNVLDSLKNIDATDLKQIGSIGADATSGNYGAAIKGAADKFGSAGLYGAMYVATKLKAPGELLALGESQLGAIANPSLSMLFKGVQFRNFQFTWTFSAKSADESLTLKKIVDQFKKNHLPTFAGSDSSLIFNYPNICKPRFSMGTGNNPYITDFQYCVIKSVDVKYSPQGNVPAFYAKTKAPVFLQLTVVLEEMEYRLPQSYDGSNEGPSASDIVSDQFTGAYDKVSGIIDAFKGPADEQGPGPLPGQQ